MRIGWVFIEVIILNGQKFIPGYVNVLYCIPVAQYTSVQRLHTEIIIIFLTDKITQTHIRIADQMTQ